MTTSRKIKIAFGLCIVFQGLILSQLLQMTNPSDALTLQLSLFPATFQSIISQWSLSDYQHYLNHYYFDFIYPLVYGYFLMLLLNNRSLVIWPAVASICDVLENLGHVILILNLDSFSLTIWRMAAVAAWAKWLILASLALVIAKNFIKSRLPTNSLQ